MSYIFCGATMWENVPKNLFYFQLFRIGMRYKNEKMAFQ